MEQYRLPDPGLVNGLSRLVDDLTAGVTSSEHGLSRVVVGNTELISFGDQSVCYCGEPVHELLDSGSFDRVIWLLLTQSLPLDEHLADIQAILTDSAQIDVSASQIPQLLPLGARPLDLLPVNISLLTFFDPTPQDRTAEATRSRIWRLLAQLPIMIGLSLGHEFRNGTIAGLDEHPELSWAGRLLYCLRPGNGEPTPTEEAAMQAVLTCECLTDMRPACFSARFGASTVSDVTTAVQMAATLFVSQLRNDPFQWCSDLLNRLIGPTSAEEWWQRRNGQPMPFGFSDCDDDSRPAYLRQVCHSLLGCPDRLRMEASAVRLERIQASSGLYPTTDWMAARIMSLLDIPADRQSLVVAMARIAGWAAQAIEQQNSAIPLLPQLRYAGQPRL